MTPIPTDKLEENLPLLLSQLRRGVPVTLVEGGCELATIFPRFDINFSTKMPETETVSPQASDRSAGSVRPQYQPPEAQPAVQSVGDGAPNPLPDSGEGEVVDAWWRGTFEVAVPVPTAGVSLPTVVPEHVLPEINTDWYRRDEDDA